MVLPIRKTRRVWIEAGHAHFVTYSCYRRLPLLTRSRSRSWVIDALAGVRRLKEIAIWGYVVMPEHVHVLLCPRRRPYEMRAILAALKRPVAKAARAWLLETDAKDWLARLTVRYPGRTVFRFWQAGGGYDQNIVTQRSVETILEYMHANPVRRELVRTPTDWEWSSARFWEGDRNVPLTMDHPNEAFDHDDA